MSINDVENILRRAPQPKPPGNLQQRLRAQALNAPRVSSTTLPDGSTGGSWLARWWPAVAPIAVSLACAATMTAQRAELKRLRNPPANIIPAAGVSVEAAGHQTISGPQNLPESVPDEVVRLRKMADRLKAEVSKLEQIRQENEQLRGQLASRVAGVFTPEETKAMDEARDRAARIQCVNNLKQLCLAVRVWSIDHKDMSPPDILSMSNELGSFKILVCPADTGRQAAADAASFTPANCSYEYLAPSASDTEPERIAFRCPIHGNLGLIDGSVQSSIAKNHPDWIVQRDGKLFMEAPQPPADSSGPQTGGTNQAQ